MKLDIVNLNQLPFWGHYFIYGYSSNDSTRQNYQTNTYKRIVKTSQVYIILDRYFVFVKHL